MSAEAAYFGNLPRAERDLSTGIDSSRPHCRIAQKVREHRNLPHARKPLLHRLSYERKPWGPEAKNVPIIVPVSGTIEDRICMQGSFGPPVVGSLQTPVFQRHRSKACALA